MSDKTSKYLNTFKTEEELRAYIDAQQQSFIEVSKKVRNLEDENESLKKKVEKLQTEQNKEKSLLLEAQNISNAEIICLKQLEDLRNISDSRTYTLEETKRFEILTKIYEQIKTAKKTGNEDLANKSTEELLQLIPGGNGST